MRHRLSSGRVCTETSGRSASATLGGGHARRRRPSRRGSGSPRRRPRRSCLFNPARSCDTSSSGTWSRTAARRCGSVTNRCASWRRRRVGGCHGEWLSTSWGAREKTSRAWSSKVTSSNAPPTGPDPPCPWHPLRPTPRFTRLNGSKPSGPRPWTRPPQPSGRRPTRCKREPRATSPLPLETCG